MSDSLSRRAALGRAAALAVTATVAGTATATPKPRPPRRDGQFLWGVACAGHQVEGNNIASDNWLLESIKPTVFPEPSGDACDFYHRFREDADIAAGIGCNAWRLGIEWARIEPEPGRYSQAALDHYARVIDHGLERGLAPVLTLHHWSSPRWLAARGGFEEADTVDRYAAYADRVARKLGDRLAAAVTFNEPNVVDQVTWSPHPAPAGGALRTFMAGMMGAAAAACGSTRFSTFLFGDPQKTHPVIMKAHQAGLAALKAGPGSYPVGLSLAIADEQGVGEGNLAARKQAEIYGPWLDLLRDHGDFVGVQTYTRTLVGPAGNLPIPAGAEKTAAQYEFYPEALEGTVTYAVRASGKPVYVTENGVSTHDDTRRIAYIGRALAALQRARAAGVAVRGYFHWTLLDCYEWTHGYTRPFGLVAVDRQSFARTPKPSARFYGQCIRKAKA